MLKKVTPKDEKVKRENFTVQKSGDTGRVFHGPDGGSGREKGAKIRGIWGFLGPWNAGKRFGNCELRVVRIEGCELRIAN
jgi:hypothetical protein